jgi:hypothetical protein
MRSNWENEVYTELCRRGKIWRKTGVWRLQEVRGSSGLVPYVGDRKAGAAH